MASEETTLTAHDANETAAPHSVADHNTQQSETLAEHTAENTGAHQVHEQPATAAANNFETEATAPEIAAYNAVEQESGDGSSSANTTDGEKVEHDQTAGGDLQAQGADEVTPNPPPSPAENAGENASLDLPVGEAADVAQTATAETVVPDELTPADDIEPETAAVIEEPPPAKKENVVVRKLKLNPNAKPPAPPQPSGATATSANDNQPPATVSNTAAAAQTEISTPRAVAKDVAPATDESPVDNLDFGAILEQFEQEQQEHAARFREGTLLEGRVVSVSDRGVMIDFGYKAEGVVPQTEFMHDGALTVQPGDTTEIVVKRLDTPEGTPELSRFEAVKARTWEELEKASQDGTPVKGRVVDKTKGGLTVDINGIEAFLPGSQIESRPPRSLDGYKGQEVEARVIKFSRKRGNIVLSRKVLLDEVNNSQKSETLANIAEGFIVEGKIKSMTEYGAFVDLGGIDGLLHVTDMSWGKLDRPSDMFKVGDDAQVKVLKIDRDKERISLGYKQLIPNPWQSIEERYAIGSRHHGVVTSTTDYGAFVELEPGVEGLIHVSEMTWSKRAKHPNKIVRPGQEIDVQVLRIDPKERRVSLGMRQVMENPWETIRDRYPIGARVKGRVRNMTDFGAFVELEEGVDGLVHLSDITHSKKIKHPSDVLKKNQEVEAIVTGINIEGRRMSLSMKELQPSTWDQFVETHKPGDVVTGKISRFANFGVFVELADDLEGLCHISELSDERIEKPESVFQVGQELEFKILRIESDVQKIGLSHRAVGKEDDDSVVDTKTYSSEAKSSMASLGELANLRNRRDDS